MKRSFLFIILFSFISINAQTNPDLIKGVNVFLKTFDVANADSKTLSAKEEILNKYIQFVTKKIDENNAEIKNCLQDIRQVIRR